jgi:hypothetical protein
VFTSLTFIACARKGEAQTIRRPYEPTREAAMAAFASYGRGSTGGVTGQPADRTGTGAMRPEFTHKSGNVVVPPQSEECRAQARKWEERAKRTKDPMAKRAALNRARQLHKLARLAENAAVVLQSEHCRGKARDCQERAVTADDPSLKSFWLALGQHWQQLATTLEENGRG